MAVVEISRSLCVLCIHKHTELYRDYSHEGVGVRGRPEVNADLQSSTEQRSDRGYMLVESREAGICTSQCMVG